MTYSNKYMKKVLFVLFFSLISLSFSQERNIAIEFEKELWSTTVFKRHYPDWPQISVVKVEYQNGLIYYTSFNSYRKQLILRGQDNADYIYNDPNVLKSKILNISPGNRLVKAYWVN